MSQKVNDLAIFPINDNCDSKNYFVNSKQIDFLPNFNTINLFIGANNSGKSRFMRFLMKQKKAYFIEDFSALIENFKNIDSYIDSLSNDIVLHNKKYLTQYGLEYDQNSFINGNSIIFNKFNWTSQQIAVCNTNSTVKELKKITYLIKVLQIHNKIIKQYSASTNKPILLLKRSEPIVEEIDSRVLEMISNYALIIEHALQKRAYKELIKNIYIPTLRTSHSIFQQNITNGGYKKIREDIFLETIIRNYKLNENEIDIFTGLNLYYEVLNARNSKKNDRKIFEEFEEFISTNFFPGQKLDIVARFNIDDKMNQKEEDEIIDIYVDDRSDNLYDLGDGIQALIILMYKIFLASDNTFIFIDEPELNLHPGMQRLFLEQITQNPTLTKKNLTYVISTHSNHFLDLTIDKDYISIYNFTSRNKENNKKFNINNINNGNNEHLRNLGVNNSSVFLANCSIWVEGISDRNIIKAFLRSYCKHNAKPYPREDIDFCFIEYAGSNIEHFDFEEEDNKKINAYAINSKVFLISDFDSNKGEKHLKLSKTITQNKNLIYRTTEPYREIENLLSKTVLKKTLLNFCKKSNNNLESTQKQIDIILDKIDLEKYIDKYLGVLLKNVVKKNVPSLNKIWKEKNGIPQTLLNKTEFSYTILNNNNITWVDFSENRIVARLVPEIYNFIMQSKN